MIESLEYHGKEMNPFPTDTSLTSLVHDLMVGRSATVELQPGDGTRYELLLVPMWENTVRLVGWGAEDSYNGLVAVRLRGGYPAGASIVFLNRPNAVNELSRLSGDNDWTATLLEWWFQHLAALINEARTPTFSPKGLSNADR